MKSSKLHSQQSTTVSNKLATSGGKFKKVAIAVIASTMWVSLGFSASAFADSHNHEKVQEAFASGQVLSLKDVLSKIESQYPGEVIEIEFETDKRDDYIYEIKILQDDGALVKLKVDATNAEVLKTKTRDKKRKKQ